MQSHLTRAFAIAFLCLLSVSFAAGQKKKAQEKKAQADQLLKPVDWSVVTVPGAGMDVHLRTAWEEDRLKYMVRIDDKEGKLAKYLLKLRALRQDAPIYVFTIVFSDESGFHPYRDLDIPWYALVQEAGTTEYGYASSDFQNEKDYRSLINGKTTHTFKYPVDLGQ